MRWLLPVVVSILIVLLYVTPQGTQVRKLVLPAQYAAMSEAGDEQSSADDDDDEEHPSRLRKQNGLLGIELTPETQAISGIEVQPAESMQHRREIRALAEVISLQPLLKLRSDSDSLRAEIAITEVQLKHSREAFERLSALHEDNANISARQLEEARTKMQADRAKLAARKQQLQSLHEEAVQEWGETLAEEALKADDSDLMQQLISHRDVLLNLTLSHDQTLPETSRIVFVNREARRRNARKAQLISPAPRTEPNLQGETYFLHTRANKLRVGMRMHAWIPVDEETREGVRAPLSAIVWHSGQPWIYLFDGEDFFYRRALDEPTKLGDGWFIPGDQVSAGERIVTSGAQMLLSEEYRWQIPDEDDDP